MKRHVREMPRNGTHHFLDCLNARAPPNCGAGASPQLDWMMRLNCSCGEIGAPPQVL